MTQQFLARPGTTQRLVVRKTQSGAIQPGFAGPGHTAAEVFGPRQLELTDPFVMLMDDRLDFVPGQPVGEPHPHAGLETVTLMLEGSLDDSAEGLLEKGDLAWMSAGRGIIHNENVKATGYARILQLWVALPSAARDFAPDFEHVPLSSLPIRREPGVEARLYSGQSGELTSPTRNRVPITIVDFHMQAGAQVSQALPGAYRGFAFVEAGSLVAGGVSLKAGEIGWLDQVDAVETELLLRAGPEGARVILYAGQPSGEPIVQHGPFVAGSRHELAVYYQQYTAGHFERIGAVAARLSGR